MMKTYPFSWRSLFRRTPRNAPAISRGAELRMLIGKHGRTTTKLRLGGYIEVEGKEFEAIAQGQFIDKDVSVRVVSVRFGTLWVVPHTPTP